MKKKQARKIAGLLADFCGLWVINSGLKSGILLKISEAKSSVMAADLVKDGKYSLFFLETWLKAAYSFGILDYIHGKGFTPAPCIKDILLNKADSYYLGSTIMMFSELSNIYRGFSKRIKDGKKFPLSRQSIAVKKAMAEVTKSDSAFIIERVIKGSKEFLGIMDRGAAVLDIGTGLGYAAINFSKAFPGIKVIALDIDKKSIAAARKNIYGEGCKRNISLMEKDAKKADFKQKFDFIFMNLSLHEIGGSDNERQSFLNKCRAWLKDNGFLLISELPFPSEIKEYRKLSSRIILGIQMFEAIFGDRLMAASGISRLLRKSGFRKINIIEHPNPLRAFILARR